MLSGFVEGILVAIFLPLLGKLCNNPRGIQVAHAMEGEAAGIIRASSSRDDFLSASLESLAARSAVSGDLCSRDTSDIEFMRDDVSLRSRNFRSRSNLNSLEDSFSISRTTFGSS